MKKINFFFGAILLPLSFSAYSQNTWDGSTVSTTTTNGVVNVGIVNSTNYATTPTVKLKVVENNPFIELEDKTTDPYPAMKPSGCGIRLSSFLSTHEIKTATNSTLGQGLFIHNAASSSNIGFSLFDSKLFIGGMMLSGGPGSYSTSLGDVIINKSTAAQRLTVYAGAPTTALSTNYNFGAYGNSLFSSNVLIGEIRSNAPSFPLEVVGEVASLGLNRGFRVFGGLGDNMNSAPWYGMGLSNTTFNGELGTAVQLAGYYGLSFNTRASQGTTGIADMTIQNGKVTIGSGIAGSLEVNGNGGWGYNISSRSSQPLASLTPTKLFVGVNANANKEVFSVLSNGNTIIGPAYITPASVHNNYKLSVGGKLVCQSLCVVKPTATDWADYVFSKSYKLRSLNEVEKYINENNHLPNVPSAAEIKENGIDAGDMLRIQMEKIEELTLYMIEMKKENERMKQELEALKNSVTKQ